MIILYIKLDHIPLSIIISGWSINANYINHHPQIWNGMQHPAGSIYEPEFIRDQLKFKVYEAQTEITPSALLWTLLHSVPTLWDRTKESSHKSMYRSIGMSSCCHSPASPLGHFPLAWQLNSYLSAGWYTLKVIISWRCRKVSVNSPSCIVNLSKKWEKTVLMFNLII